MLYDYHSLVSAEILRSLLGLLLPLALLRLARPSCASRSCLGRRILGAHGRTQILHFGPRARLDSQLRYAPLVLVLAEQGPVECVEAVQEDAGARFEREALQSRGFGELVSERCASRRRPVVSDAQSDRPSRARLVGPFADATGCMLESEPDDEDAGEREQRLRGNEARRSRT